MRARFLAAAFSDGSYLAHVNGAYLHHVKFCIVRGPTLFIFSPISQRGPLPRLVQSPRRRTPASPTEEGSRQTRCYQHLLHPTNMIKPILDNILAAIGPFANVLPIVKKRKVGRPTFLRDPLRDQLASLR